MKKLINKLLKSIESSHNKNKNLALLALPKFEGITLIDIGAAGDIEPRWKAVEANLNYIGFEPDERSRKELLNKKNTCREYTIYGEALSDGAGEMSLNLCRKPQVSSIYKPNKEFTYLFPDYERFDVLSNEAIKTKKLDDINISNPDFVKLDIQGGELKALLGGEKTLRETFGLEIEVEFLPLYIEQPLFGDITSFLSNKGFEFIDFVNLCRWERESHSGYGQCVFGDALYLKSPELVLDQKLEDRRISSYLSILLLYKRFDLIKRALELLPQNLKKNFSLFESKLKKIEQSHNKARKISLITNRLLRIFETDSRNYLLY
jgi:FkbM family methyltransferase